MLQTTRLALSVCLVAAILVIGLRTPEIHQATVALLMIMAIVILAKAWGQLASLTAAVAGGAGFVWYFLPPRGFSIQTLEDVADLWALLLTAIVTGQLVTRSDRQRVEAQERISADEKLSRLTEAALGGGPDFTWARLGDRLAEVFDAEGVALYDARSGQIVRSGRRAGNISDERLRQIAGGGLQPANTGGAVSAAAIRHSGSLVGSIWISGVRLSEPVLCGVADRVGLGLARLYSIEKCNDAEVVRRCEELKSAVLDAMAHDIRNPLHCIKVAATALLSEHPGTETQKREMIKMINEEADHMDRVLDDAANVSYVETDGLLVKKEPQDPGRLIRAAIEDLGELSGRRVSVSAPEWLPPAECDRDLILRVLRQLLSNALKYSPVDSPLRLSAQFTGTAVVIDVVDCGPGVADDERERIFERHFRGRAAFGTKGTGTGLASARAIVRAHGGEIWVTGASGGGAAFHISLPVTAGSAIAGRVMADESMRVRQW